MPVQHARLCFKKIKGGDCTQSVQPPVCRYHDGGAQRRIAEEASPGRYGSGQALISASQTMTALYSTVTEQSYDRLFLHVCYFCQSRLAMTPPNLVAAETTAFPNAPGTDERNL